MSWLLSLVFLANPTVNVSADFLETKASSWRARGAVTVEGQGWRLKADLAESRVTPQCPSGELVLMGKVEVLADAGRGHAESITGCNDSAMWAGRKIGIHAPRLRLSADLAQLEGTAVSATGVRTTACGCRDAPWHVTASTAVLTLGEGAWLHWPVLWLGPIPIATIPRWYIPATRRQTGLLSPRLRYGGEAGWTAILPIFFTLGQSADITVSPGWRHADGLTGSTTLRWAARPMDRGELRVDGVERGLLAMGQGTLPWGPARLGLAMDFASDADIRNRLNDDYEGRRRLHTASLMGLHFTGSNVGLGGRAMVLQSLHDDPSAGPKTQLMPQGWFRFSAPFEAGQLQFDLSASRFERTPDPKRDVLRIGSKGQRVDWFGPLRLQLEGGVLSQTVQVSDSIVAPLQSLLTFGKATLQLEAARRWRRVVHTITMTASPQWAGLNGTAAAGLPLVPLSSAGVALGLSTRLTAGLWRGTLTIHQPYEIRAPVNGWMPTSTQLTLETPWGGFNSSIAGDGQLWLRGHLESGALGLRGGWAHRDPLRRVSPWRRQWGPYGPFELDSAPTLSRTAGLGITLRGYGLEWMYDTLVDVSEGKIANQGTRFIYVPACDCLTITLGASKASDRRRPDFFMTVGL